MSDSHLLLLSSTHLACVLRHLSTGRLCWGGADWLVRILDADLEALSCRRSTWTAILVCSWASSCFLALSKRVLFFLRSFLVADTFFYVDATSDSEVSSLSWLGYWLFLLCLTWTTICLAGFNLGIVRKLISWLTSWNLRVLLICWYLRRTLDDRSRDSDIAGAVESQGRKRTQNAIRSLV